MSAPAPPRASRNVDALACRQRRRVAHGVPAVVDHDGIAALERGLRADGPQPGHELSGALGARRDGPLRRSVEHGAQAAERLAPRDHPVVGAAQRGPGRQRLESLAGTHDRALGTAAGARAQALDVLQLLAGVGDDQARRVGGRRGPAVGDEIAQRHVALVPDGRDDDRRAGGDRAAEPLVRERQEILERPAAARDHDHVDIGTRVERSQRAQHLGHGALALHRRLGLHEARRGEPGARVADDVERRRGVVTADQADAARPQRRRSLASGLEEPVGVEPAARLLDAREQRAVAGGLDARPRAATARRACRRASPCRAPAPAAPRPACGSRRSKAQRDIVTESDAPSPGSRSVRKTKPRLGL